MDEKVCSFCCVGEEGLGSVRLARMVGSFVVGIGFLWEYGFLCAEDCFLVGREMTDGIELSCRHVEVELFGFCVSVWFVSVEVLVVRS